MTQMLVGFVFGVVTLEFDERILGRRFRSCDSEKKVNGLVIDLTDHLALQP